jgi:hypothetical protein
LKHCERKSHAYLKFLLLMILQHLKKNKNILAYDVNGLCGT